MNRRLEAEKAAYAAKEAETRAAMAKEASAPTTPPRDATVAAEAMAAAVADLPPASKEKAKKVARRMTKAERQAAKEAKALHDLIEKKRQAERDGTTANAEAVKAKAKETSRRVRNAIREPMAMGPL